MPRALALNERVKIGEVIPWLNLRFRVVKKISRARYLRELEHARAARAAEGRRKARAGTYCEETKEFIPGHVVPEEFRFCYYVEQVE